MPTIRSDNRNARQPLHRRSWWLPSFSVAIGLVMLVAFWIGGAPDQGAVSLGVMTMVALVFAVGGRRSETLGGLGGPGRDERWERIDIHATALTGLVLIAVILGAWMWEIAHGRDGAPYAALGAVGGIAYMGWIALLRRHS